MRRVLFSLARMLIFQKLIGFVFAHMNMLFPFERLAETNDWIAFRHPEPTYQVHILLVPKKAISNLLAISEEELDLIKELIPLVKKIVMDLQLEKCGYRLISNGGIYQEIPQLHFHLVSGNAIK